MGTHKHGPKTTVFVCCGSCCRESKAKKVYRRLEEAVMERGLGELFEVRKAHCLKQCKHGPVVMLEDGDKKFARVKPKGVEAVLDKIVKRRRERL